MSALELALAGWACRARQAPDRVAVVELGGDGRTWTRAELHARAQALVVAWKAVGVRPGHRVLVLDPAGGEWVAKLWAAWQLGAVFAPLPWGASEDRFAAQSAHADPHVISHGDRHEVREASQPACPPAVATLITTSGTTGTPKAVLGTREGFPALWHQQAAAFDTREDDVVGWMLSPAFDASLSDVGVAMTAGARLVVVPPGRWRHGKTWRQDVAEHGITQLDAPPSWLALWADQAPPPGLRSIVAGGEPTAPAILRRWSTRLRWTNVYGPTEATVCTSWEHRRVATGQTVEPTLGQPMAGVTYRLQPPGSASPFTTDEPVEGELWIGGPCVGWGYWRDAALSAERFVVEAARPDLPNGRRWFRTGDRVRRVGEAWWFLGRYDRQVKRYGQLLHLDGVEAALAAADAPLNAVFLDAQDKLVAVVSDHSPANEVLRERLRRRSAPWGVPQRWCRVPEASWPRTATGKTDRAALLEQAGTGSDLPAPPSA